MLQYLQVNCREYVLTKKKIAILGAGSSGLAQLRAFEAARLAGVKNLSEIVCYEKQNDIGGMSRQMRNFFDQAGALWRKVR